MSPLISVTINGMAVTNSLFSNGPITIRETDFIKIRITATSSQNKPEVYFEDYQSELLELNEDGVDFYETANSCFFSESFGYAALRIEFEDQRIIFPFDVQAKKTSVDQARKMIHYLASHSERLVSTCFSRSSISIGSNRADSIDSETMLSTAEAFIEKLQSFQSEFLNNIRERLLPIRLPVWQANIYNREIDPYDVINNLDALTPSSSGGDVFLRGRNFDLSGIYVSSVQPSADVLENRIILGGLYGIQRKVGELVQQLDCYDTNKADEYAGFESFQRLMLSLTSDGMRRRGKDLLNTTERFIRLFEQRLKVKFVGEITPSITPYVKSTRVYGLLFSQLNSWYELGTPSISGIKFLMKLKSLSKIYEIFVLFQIVDNLCRQGFIVHDAVPHETMGDIIPSEVTFKNGVEELILQYEPIVNIWSPTTSHMDLIDVGHQPGAPHPYWSPDFVLRFSNGTAVRYIILDAKYSTRSSVKDFHIPALFDKYYVATAVYDSFTQTATHAPIVGIFAIFSLDDRSTSYVSKWRRHGINNDLPRIPMVGGVGLMVDNSLFFNESMSSALNILRRTIGGRTTL